MNARAHNLNNDALAIVQKYEDFRCYLYPILQCAERKHRVLRDEVIKDLIQPVRSLYHAARSKQLSRLHAVDGDFAVLRSHMRFMVEPKVKILSLHQHEVALGLLAEPGRMLGAWQKKLKEKGEAGQ